VDVVVDDFEVVATDHPQSLLSKEGLRVVLYVSQTDLEKLE
jgi:hypothetical protein